MVFLDADQIMTLADEVTGPPIRTGGGEHRRHSYPERGLLVRFAGFTGLRSAEIVALRTESVDLLRGRGRVVSSATEASGKLQLGPPKTYQRRSVPLPASLVEELTTHLAGPGCRRVRVHVIERRTTPALELLRPTLQACRAPRRASRGDKVSRPTAQLRRHSHRRRRPPLSHHGAHGPQHDPSHSRDLRSPLPQPRSCPPPSTRCTEGPSHLDQPMSARSATAERSRDGRPYIYSTRQSMR